VLVYVNRVSRIVDSARQSFSVVAMIVCSCFGVVVECHCYRVIAAEHFASSWMESVILVDVILWLFTNDTSTQLL